MSSGFVYVSRRLVCRLFAPCERVINKATGAREKQGGIYVLKTIEQRGTAARTFERTVRGVLLAVCIPAPREAWRWCGHMSIPAAVRLLHLQARYYWIYQGNESWNNIKLALVVVAIVACTCYQVELMRCSQQ